MTGVDIYLHREDVRLQPCSLVKHVFDTGRGNQNLAIVEK